MFPTNHKTIFVLDHTPYFGISSDFPIEFDVSKSRGPGYVPLPPVCKSLWTCSVEAAVEYCRIVWDLFPEGKLIRFVVSDSAAHLLNTWAVAQQNLTHILNGLSLVGPVRRGAGGDVVGLCAAIEALGEPSPTQSSRPTTERLFQNRLHDPLPRDYSKIGMLTIPPDQMYRKHNYLSNASKAFTYPVVMQVFITDDDSIRSLAEIALNALVQQNKKLSMVPPTTSADADNTQSLVVHYCHLVIVNVTPEKIETRVNNQPLTEVKSVKPFRMGVEVIVSRASALANLLGRLVLPHYKLATTTVTGIPMKEEQNASSSANYDVEIIHSSEAHAGLRAAQTAAEALESVVLRWWTPRGAEGGAGGCSGPLWRVTPADVASRPSACLVNFLLNGRSVTLEVPRKGGGRSASHVLAAQGGELWIGALGGRMPYDDPPALSEGAGGRVTDYRIKEFGSVMQQNKLLPLRGAGANGRARARLQRHTTYWPLTISSTIIFNLGPVVEPLSRLVVQETLSEAEVEACRGVLLSLLGMESRHESPAAPLPSNVRYGTVVEPLSRLVVQETLSEAEVEACRGVLLSLLGMESRHESPAAPLPSNVRVKWCGRREEQWRQVWGELEALVRAHAASPAHRALLRTLLECRGHNHNADGESRASVIRATTDSPLSPVGAGGGAAGSSAGAGDVWAPRNALEALLGAPRPPRRPDFAGRMAAGNRVATLYSHLQDVEAQH
ncbi:Cell cycle regulator Mat89Bb-like [Papilio machaon]|uniref:Protein asunder n=1 Tax=Papilio machaon TaxID=76193 RepID=A0A194QRU2_PAPMA|nr:Cell cycle regulator Mat89Bb-like [Papilio machaon]